MGSSKALYINILLSHGSLVLYYTVGLDENITQKRVLAPDTKTDLVADSFA